jgi:subtilisin-like proprotein convertase family protein
MKKLLLLLAMVIFSHGYSQNLWAPADQNKLAGLEKKERTSNPREFKLFTLNLQELKTALKNAPDRENYTGPSDVIVAFPNASGKLENYRVYEASVLSPVLAAKHPSVKSYVGRGIDNPAATVRFSVTMYGLHAMILSPEGTVYTDPYTKDMSSYITYNKASLVSGPRTFRCYNESTEKKEVPAPPAALSNDGLLRKYRLAMASTIEYSAYHINAAGVSNGTLAEKKAAVLEAMTVSMTRIDGVYEQELAITMQLVDDNEDIIFVTSDNLNNNNAEVLIGQVGPVISGAIGASSYDIGHCVSTGAGGLASLGCVCTSVKAQGVTGSPSPVDDAYDIDYVAHEMGHQFGADHTFNGTGGSCTGNANNSTAVEPGSGSTIMAYAGICSGNVQQHSDAYFHTVSLAEIFNYINTNSGDCAVTVANNNTTPVIANLTSYTIPKGTAFILKGNGTDADGDTLYYCWEQTDTGTGGTLSQAQTSGPNYRSYKPTLSPNRYMPVLSSVLNGNLAPSWEKTPTVERNLHFALTVRDNIIETGGQTARKDMTVHVEADAGPFAVTSQTESGISYEGGSQQTITWNVAGTTANGVNTANVNILLSTDGGQNFSTVLVSGTANDGSETVTIPNVEAASCRIMVEAADNIYYAVNDTHFAINFTVVNTCEDLVNAISVTPEDGATTLSSSVINVEGNGIVTSVTVDALVDHADVSELMLELVSPEGTVISLWDMQCAGNAGMDVTFSDAGTAVTCDTPVTGTVLPQDALSGLNGEQVNGDWTLRIGDMVTGNTGELTSWSLNVCYDVTAGVNELALQNFTVYPNPGNGNFTVEFASQAAEDVTIAVSDMGGRQIFTKGYKNSGMFSANVNLGNVQSGIYLVTVHSGATKETRKIVVN